MKFGVKVDTVLNVATCCTFFLDRPNAAVQISRFAKNSKISPSSLALPKASPMSESGCSASHFPIQLPICWCIGFDIKGIVAGTRCSRRWFLGHVFETCQSEKSVTYCTSKQSRTVTPNTKHQKTNPVDTTSSEFRSAIQACWHYSVQLLHQPHSFHHLIVASIYIFANEQSSKSLSRS